MTIVGIGIDIISLDRVRNIRYQTRAAEYIFTEDEMTAYVQASDKTQYFASRLAVKEAVIKAFPSPLTYHDIFIGKEGKKPIVTLAAQLGVQNKIHVSISHEFNNVVGMAIVC
jgi:holo-[acyl-carrier protein] synthase